MPSSLRPGGSTTRWRRLRAHVLARDGGVCYVCGQAGANSVDHVRPRSLGGGDDLANLKAAHLRCNLVKGARLLPDTVTGQPSTSRAW